MADRSGQRDELLRPRHLTREVSEALRPFEQLAYEMTKLVKEASDRDLRLVARSKHEVSQINCGWAQYDVALWPALQREAAWELKSREKRRQEADRG